MAKIFDAPPTLTGDELEQTGQIYQYLLQMSEQLNEAMHTLAAGDSGGDGTYAIRLQSGKTGGGEGSDELIKTKNALRSMIIKTAEVVRTEMDEISTVLHETIQAESERFGDLTVQLEQRITANAEGIEQNFEYCEVINAKTGDYDQFITRMSERIFSGIIGYNSQTGMPIVGIAIGENITAYDQEGNPYINDNAKMATFTKDRLSFWQGTTEVAYISDSTLRINTAELMQEMRMGNYVWRIQSDNSLGLMVSII